MSQLVEQQVSTSENGIFQERERNQVLLREFIRSQGGQISFDQFWQFSLFDRQSGYYPKVVNIGSNEEGADFQTFAHNPLFARSMVRFAQNDLMRPGASFIEAAGGNGKFKKNALRFLTELGIECPYLSIDISDKLIDMQNMIDARSVQANACELPLATNSVEGVIFANELLDTFRHKVLRVRTKFREMTAVREYRGIEELYYGLGDNGVITAYWGSPSESAVAHWQENWQYLAEKGIFPEDFNDKTGLTFAPSLASVATEFIRVMRAGKIILVDYGGNLEDLLGDIGKTDGMYIRQYPSTGSVALESLPSRVFECDITTNVDFSSLIAVAKASGCRCQLHTQRTFCLRQVSDEDERIRRADPAIHTEWEEWMLDRHSPYKTSDTFKVLVIDVDKTTESREPVVSQNGARKLLSRLRHALG